MPRDKWGRVIEDKKAKFVKPFKPRGGLYNSHLKTRPVRKETKIRNPVKYLVDKHNMPKKYAKEFLAQHPVIQEYWKEDSLGPYVDSEFLDSIGYGWKHERKEFMSGLRSTEKVRKFAIKSLKEEYGKDFSYEDMEERIPKLPLKYQRDLRRTQRIMKKIKEN